VAHIGTMLSMDRVPMFHHLHPTSRICPRINLLGVLNHSIWLNLSIVVVFVCTYTRTTNRELITVDLTALMSISQRSYDGVSIDSSSMRTRLEQLPVLRIRVVSKHASPSVHNLGTDTDIDLSMRTNVPLPA
jgi:hypothetical protein